MKMYVHLQYLAQFFLEWEIIQTNQTCIADGNYTFYIQ